MHKIKEMLLNELYEYEEKARKMPDGKVSLQELEKIHKLTDTVKNIDKIEMLEEDGYSEASEWMGDGRIYGNSYAKGGRRGEHYVRGHYSRDGENFRKDDGYSYTPRKRDSMGRYSKDGAKDHMIEKMEEMLEDAESPKEREAIRQCIQKIENV